MNRVAKIVEASYAYKLNIYGKNIGVAILDTGIDHHMDLVGRTIAFKDFCYGEKRAYDDNGHGTHVAGIIGGNGHAENGKYTGIAPECNFIVMKVLDKMGNGDTEDVLKACNWIMENKEKYNIRIMNISVGMKKSAIRNENDKLLHKIEEVWNDGIVVVAAAGNQGPAENSVTIPGICESVITVGSYDDELLSGKKRSLRVGYSGRGPTGNCIVKPEVLAPGTNVVSCGMLGNNYERKSGTSMATPVVSGAIALLLEKEPKLEPAQVKIKLHDSCLDIGKPLNEQGWGILNIRNLLS